MPRADEMSSNTQTRQNAGPWGGHASASLVLLVPEILNLDPDSLSPSRLGMGGKRETLVMLFFGGVLSGVTRTEETVEPTMSGRDFCFFRKIFFTTRGNLSEVS